MSIFIDNETKVVVQGLTGEQGKFHALRNRDYGTTVSYTHLTLPTKA